jgi:hypothetical protein
MNVEAPGCQSIFRPTPSPFEIIQLGWYDGITASLAMARRSRGALALLASGPRQPHGRPHGFARLQAGRRRGSRGCPGRVGRLRTTPVTSHWTQPRFARGLRAPRGERRGFVALPSKFAGGPSVLAARWSALQRRQTHFAARLLSTAATETVWVGGGNGLAGAAARVGGLEMVVVGLGMLLPRPLSEFVRVGTLVPAPRTRVTRWRTRVTRRRTRAARLLSDQEHLVTV